MDGLHDIGNLRNRHVRDGAGRALVRGRFHARAALVGNDKARGAHGLAAAADGTEVARVGQVVADDHHGAAVVRLGVFIGSIDDLADAHITERRGFRHDALMAAARGFLVKLLLGNLDDLHAVALRLAQNVLNHGVAFHEVAHQNAAHGNAGAERLDDRALSFDVVSHRGPFESKRTLLAIVSAGRSASVATEGTPAQTQSRASHKGPPCKRSLTTCRYARACEPRVRNSLRACAR